jgi:four helix bundle protein
MGLQNFESYKLSVMLYHECERIRCPGYLKLQLMRASSSVSLNLSEGSAKQSVKDRMRFYVIALGSLREVQAAFDLIRLSKDTEAFRLSNQLGAYVYRLTHPK